jgi:hypothetical protein
MDSKIRTPGITGLFGKCPWKKGSLIVTFFIAVQRFPGSMSIILSIRING